MSELTFSKTKIHRHFVPKFIGTLPKLVPVTRFAKALESHDWNRNPHIYKLRIARNQRVSVRSERRETYNELALAMIANANYSVTHDYIFEVMCSTEHLAKLCGQLYKYNSGRRSYDPILKAIRDWESAELIVVDRDRNSETKQYKAQRIWIKPEFFEGLGFPLKELRQVVLSLRKWMEKNGLREKYDSIYAKHVLRLAKLNVASLDGKHSLKKLLTKIKRLVVGDESLKQEKKHLEKALKHKKALIQSTENKEKPAKEAWRIYQSWKNEQPFAVVYEFENRIKREFPKLAGEQLFITYIKNLPKV